MRRRPAPRLALALTVALFTAACGGGGSDSSATTTSTEVVQPSLPVVDTDPPATDATSTSTTSTTAVPVPLNPLTGTPQTDPAAATRPALVVKIDNHPRARPQSGLGIADIVFEENVEGITRFAAVFHSQGSDPVGPIRSGRTQDVDLLGSLQRPLFAWSGGNAGVTAAINNSDLVSLSNLDRRAQAGGGFFRSNDRSAPHDLYAQSSMLWTLAPADAQTPPPQFGYRGEGEAAAGAPSAGCDVAMDGVNVGWTWDTASGTYLRAQNGQAHNDAITSGQISTHNVVVLFTEYRASAADANSPEAVTVGSGQVWVFSAGTVVRGTWTRPDRLQPFTLTADDGSPILLTPGRTFVELAKPGSATQR